MTVGGVTPIAAAATAAASRAGVYGAAGAAPLSPLAPTSGAKAAGAAKSMAGQLSTPNLFLKLLMAELTHEDPTNPTTPSSILQQTAMLSQIESMTAMTTSVNQQKRYAESTDANGLIGRQVTAFVTGHPLTGVVSGVAMTSSGTPYLNINTTFVPLASVVEVTMPSTGTKPTPTTGTTPSKTSGSTGTKTTGTGTTPAAAPAAPTTVAPVAPTSATTAVAAATAGSTLSRST